MNENEAINLKSLNYIFDKMVKTIGQSKDEVFLISEQSKDDYEKIKKELEDIKKKIQQLIIENDQLDKETMESRRYLAKVSRYFDRYTEEEVKEAYDRASNLRVLSMENQLKETEYRKRRDDLERRLNTMLETIARADQLVSQISIIMNYLTFDLKHVGEALENAQQKQEFAIQILEAQEEERKRVSREIHDGPAQMLARSLLQSQLVEKVYVDRGGQAALKELKRLREDIRETLIEVRRVIFDLRPMNLDDLGISAALKKYLAEVNHLENTVEISFNERGEFKRLQSNYEVAVFRIIQECVTNALKHGKPSNITVQLEWLSDKLNVIVKDDGKGFNLDEVKGQSFGLVGMKERVELLKGTMTTKSVINKGTIHIIQIPFMES
ncbi:MAG TPA: sensor histidine kinase [Sporosarcina sp.]|nr:sensor histidine kinase [Sporosarcina sp.]